MKILYCSAYFTPETAASLYITEDILAAMGASGNSVDFFTPMPCRGVSDEIRKDYKKNFRKEERFSGKVTVNRISLYKEGKHSLLRAIRYFLLELIFALKSFSKKYDLIFAQSTPPIHGFFSAIIKRIKRIGFVYNLQDIFPDSLVNAGMAKEGSLLYKIGRKIENYTYKNADKIIVISEGFKQNIMAKGVPENKIVVVPNWVDEEVFRIVPRKDNRLFDEYGLDREKFYVAYSGNIGLSQNMGLLVKAAKMLEDNANIHFVIIGDGVYKEKLLSLISENELKNITLIPFQPYERISEVFSIGDVGLIISKANIGTSSVPSKTWNYMAACKPILASFDLNSELAEIVKNENCGICAEADDVDAFAEAVKRLVSDCNLQELGNNGRKYVENSLSARVNTEKYVKVLTAALQKNS